MTDDLLAESAARIKAEEAARRESMIRRTMRLQQCHADPTLRAIEIALCRADIHHWFNNWVWTFDPRLAAESRPAHIPFDMFPRQHEMIDFMAARVQDREDGLIEKSRDIGFTWVAGGYALHKWIFFDGFKTTFGSRKAELVDKRGEPDSIFEKIRYMLRYLPGWMHPKGFDWNEHDNYMRLINPYNANTIAGEAGDDMGRGGRSSMYFIDEAAFIERGDSVDASTSGNSDCRIWASSVNGSGNIFFKKRFGGSLRMDQIFRFHWSDDPRKDRAWATKKRNSMEEHKWASEYDIDYNASVEGICIPAKWVQAAVDLNDHLSTDPRPFRGIVGLDVGAGGKNKSVAIARFGHVVMPPVSTGNPDTEETAQWSLDYCDSLLSVRPDGYDSAATRLCYDKPGVGAGVMSAFRRNGRPNLRVEGINTGIPASETTIWPDEETSNKKFGNLKAEIWWLARDAFKCSYELLKFLLGEKGGIEHSIDKCVIMPRINNNPEVQTLITQLSLPKWFRDEKGKIVIESKKSLAARGVASPDHADAFVLTYVPEEDDIDIWVKLGS